jgi:hypothetical protein
MWLNMNDNLHVYTTQVKVAYLKYAQFCLFTDMNTE